MGSTVAGALISGRHLFFFNVGDSRVYHQRNGQLKQLSTDDRMGASGMLMQSLVAQDLNINALMDVHHGQRVLRNGDVLLLCTDGLTDVLSDTEIEQALAQPGAADTLVLLALERGAPGNVSCVVAVVEDAAH